MTLIAAKESAVLSRPAGNRQISGPPRKLFGHCSVGIFVLIALTIVIYPAVVGRPLYLAIPRTHYWVVVGVGRVLLLNDSALVLSRAEAFQKRSRPRYVVDPDGSVIFENPPSGEPSINELLACTSLSPVPLALVPQPILSKSPGTTFSASRPPSAMIVNLYFVAAMLLLAAGLITRSLVLSRRRHWQRIGNGRCIECNYNLTGNQSNKCPECGTPTPNSEPAAPIQSRAGN